jgi:hypothetical protein
VLIAVIAQGSGPHAELIGQGAQLAAGTQVVVDACALAVASSSLGSAGTRIEFWSVDGYKIDDIVLPHARLLPHGLPHGAR